MTDEEKKMLLEAKLRKIREFINQMIEVLDE